MEKTSDFLVGSVVLIEINLVMLPPTISISREGVTSRRIMSVTLPARKLSWIEAQTATALSGVYTLAGLATEDGRDSDLEAELLGVEI